MCGVSQSVGVHLDFERCYTAVESRDIRFDGWFVTAVQTTGIYCRPSCPAITPRRENIEFYPDAGAAQQSGFRACKRCAPDASAGSPEWDRRQDIVARAMRLIGDGVVDRDGVAGLAQRLSYSERQLNRLVVGEIGAGPEAIARARRAQTARTLIERTSMPFADVAFAAGFGSVRQFNDTVRSIYAATPTTLRRTARGTTLTEPPEGSAGWVQLRLPTRKPFAGDLLLQFFGARAISGIESWDGHTFRRTLRLPAGHGVVELSAGEDHVNARLHVSSFADFATAVQRVRRMLDLDADAMALDEHLSRSPMLQPFVSANPGRRAPASPDPFEAAVKTIVGQQVSVAGARTVTARLVAAIGDPLSIEDRELTHVFPQAAHIAEAPGDTFSMPAARADALKALSRSVADGEIELDHGSDPALIREQLLSLRGIGPWTADYILMRGLGHPDVFLETDLGVTKAIERLGIGASDAKDASMDWAPWRSYATQHLWASLEAS